jgi:ABC-type transport system substrate-binding protein
LTAEDVKATYQRIIFPPQGFSSPRTPLFSTVEAIHVRDAHTIAFQLREARPKAFMLGAFASGWNIIVRKKTLEDHNYNLRQILDYPGTGRSGTRSASTKRSGSWSGIRTTGTRTALSRWP